jgi:hypothetical protein
MGSVEVIAAATIWSMFACFLLFPRLGLPPLLHRSAMTLLVAEIVALGMWSYGSPGDPGSQAGRSLAALDIPLLAVALVALAIIRGVRGARRKRRVSG